MPSTIEDFKNQVALTSPYVGLGAIENTGYNYKVTDSDMYHFPVTFTNSGTEVTDMLVSFTFDHRAILQAPTDRLTFRPYAAPTLSDLRVYDEDASTEIPFYANGAMSHAATVFVRVTIPAGGSKTIFYGLGGRGEDSASDPSVIGPNFNSEKTVWLTADGFDPVTTAAYEDDSPVYRVKNHAIDFFSPVHGREFGASPMRVRLNGQNGHHYLQPNGVRLSVPDPHKYSGSAPTDEISIFAVAKASTLQNHQRVYSNQDSQYVAYPWYSSASGGNPERALFIISSDGGTGTGIRTGHRANTLDITSGHWKKNTTNGMRTYRGDNVFTPIEQRNSANVNLPIEDDLEFLHFKNTEKFNGDFYELIVYKDAKLDDDDRADVYEYLNAKYRLYGDQLNITWSQGARIQKFATSGTSKVYKIDNSYKAAKTNHIQVIDLDTAALVAAGELTASCESIRVYDKQGVALPFFMINKNTSDTKVVVRIPYISAGGEFRVILTHSNFAIGSAENELAVVPEKIRDNAVLWVQAHKLAAGPISNIADSSKQSNDLVQAAPAQQAVNTQAPSRLNNIQALEFTWNVSGDPVQHYRPADVSGLLTGTNENEMTVLMVGHAKTGRENGQRLPFNSLFTFRDNNVPTSDSIFPDSFGRLLQIEQDAVLITAWPGVDPVNNISYGMSATFDNVEDKMAAYRLETNSYLKGQEITTQSGGYQFRTGHEGEFYFGARNFIGEAMNGFLAEAIILNSSVTDEEMKELMYYFNSLYHIYDDEILSVSLESSEFSDAFSSTVYNDYSHISNYESNGSIESLHGSIAKSKSKVEIMNFVEDNFVGCQPMFEWTNSSLSFEQKTKQPTERKFEILETSAPVSVRVGWRTAKGGNRGNFVTNTLNNLHTPQKIQYNDNDLLSFRFYVEDASVLDLENSKVRFSNKNRAPFSYLQWQRDPKFDFTPGQPDPFGGNEAVKITVKTGQVAVQDICSFASASGQHPQPLATYQDMHTGLVYAKVDSGSQVYTICQYGSQYANFVQSADIIGNEWATFTVQGVDGPVYENYGLRTKTGVMGAGDSIVVYSPTLAAGSQASRRLGSANFEASLADSVVNITDGFVEVKIPKSSFAGSGAWDELENLEFDFVRSSGDAVDAYISDIKFTKNYVDEPRYQNGALVSLGRSVSSDNAETFAYEGDLDGVVDSSYVNGDESTQVSVVDILSLLDGLKFGDLPTFPDSTMILDYSHLYSATNSEAWSFAAGMHTIKFVLGLIFPTSLIKPSTSYRGTEFTFSGIRAEIPQFRHFSLRRDEFVSEKIREILRGCAGIIAYNPETRLIEITRGSVLLYKDSTPIEIDSIIQFNNVTDSSIERFNSFDYRSYISVVNNSYYTPIAPGYLMGQGGLTDEIKSTGSNSSVEIFLKLENMSIGKSDLPVSIKNFHVTGWNFTAQPNGSPDNGGMKIIGARILGGDTLVLRVRNENSSSRYLHSISFDGDYHTHTNDVSHKQAFGTTGLTYSLSRGVDPFYPISNAASVKKNGLSEYPNDPRFDHVGFRIDGSSILIMTPFYFRDFTPASPSQYNTIVDDLSNIDRKISITIMRTKKIRLGDRVVFKDQSSREVVGSVIELQNINEDKQKLLIRVLEYV